MSTLLGIFIFIIPIFLLFIKSGRSTENLPPGSLGIPFFGQSLSLLQAMRANTAEKWIEQRVQKYGTISKLTLFGKSTVFICGQAANKLVFTSDGNILSNQQTQSIRMILGDRNLLELSGPDHKRVREALISFLKPEPLKLYVGKMSEEVMLHMDTHWKGKEEVKVLPLMKTLTFNIICSLLFGVERGIRREKLVNWFQEMIEGMWAIPMNMPFTTYNRSLRANKRAQILIKELISEKKSEIEQNTGDSYQDLITSMLSKHDKQNGEAISEKEIIHNVLLVMTAGHDTSSILITFMVRLFANEPSIYKAVLQEQEDIAKSKQSGESLTWDDLGKMKYTWRVALETLRMYPPVFGGFRTAVKDIEYNGYLIPKGWQVFWVTSMTHNDDKVFPEPFKFDPSRFENQAAIPPYCFIPFGAGSRICPGYEFAKIETLVTMHYLVTRFTWELCADNNFCRVPMPVPTKGLPVKITPRK
ncbi:hypothetical protein K2173_003178 [Erythroxylum novogranatense]|uniref:Cytochrome P450 n=1 Tax=Erythroxylum novogranatense TaxID=1862640 RepID=A0AAV8TA54_9ROSI|nr:hypothetical protein K2173_003178 [Erythroxylum novogranatense]